MYLCMPSLKYNIIHQTFRKQIHAHDSKIINANFSFLSYFFAVRQENERLVQDSMNRAKLAVNYTDAPPASYQEMTTASTTLHQHQNFIP